MKVFNATFNYFSYIVTVIFISGGNRSTKKNKAYLSQVADKLSHNAVSSTPRYEQGSNSQL